MKYFLKSEWQAEYQEVTKKQWVAAERNAGFHPKIASTEPRYMDVCATGGFSGGGVSGKIEHEQSDY